MNVSEEHLLPISALQHLAFCERQCALIHLEQGWEENRLTVEGRLMHERVHETDDEMRDGVWIVRGLRLASQQLGLSGIADVVEFHALEDGDIRGVGLCGRGGLWQPFPVEYKRGRPKKHNADAVQLCAQAICLEECFDVQISGGALFYGRTRRRKDVAFTDALRSETEALAERLHALVSAEVTPQAQPGKHCERCSLRDLCMPACASRRSAQDYVKRTVMGMLRETSL